MFTKSLSDVAPVVPVQSGPPALEALAPLVAGPIRSPRQPILLASAASFVAGVLTSGAAFLLQG